MEFAWEKCFDFGSFAGNLISVVVPVKMVINSHTYVFSTSNLTNYIIIDVISTWNKVLLICNS